MSTLKVSAINNASASTGGLAFSTGGNVTGAGMDLVVPSSVANSGGSVTVTGGQVAFSGVTSVSLNGVFTSSYENFVIALTLTSVASGSPVVYLRGRVSGTDRTDTYYGGYLTIGHTGTALNGYSANAVTQVRLGVISATSSVNRLSSIIQVMSPQLAQRTGISYDTQAYDGSAFIAEKGGVMEYSTTTQLDGFSIYPGSSNITGTIRVYGYRNA